ncbi:putative immunoglobulin-blocking virulence protein [Mycoplasmoides gallisepticum]|nr:putative immunoglobulin-blocking virulence protein [Mycoplasmoides gallisepticum]QEX47639.1 putative immunoglobulin-blocking virulence protein [Mycoplasmoides gallisepticum]ULH62245.1 putative immunoglobulin-blocking virulence protein [Mycoplasmoides gallisepticum]ULH67585.1 putative immunoglobulin-blocking virulence protein [Mycoplasmoides gallisepticum]ULH68313.1 putative immunoglobulin-blocking virulence protein [Mycoplasmoides gallisepticum]WGG23950.1 putative immunoglobulin-blocking vi
MISSKKRKIIKLIALSTGSVTLGVASTLGIVYSAQQKESQASLFQRSNKVSLNTNASNANDSQNSNRDFNLENAPEKPESKPVVVVNPPEKKPEPIPQPEPKKPTIEDMLPQSSEGFVDINNLPDLDFSTLKPKKNPGGKLTKEQTETIKTAVSTLVNLTKDLPKQFTDEQIRQINDAIYEIRKLGAATKNEGKKDWTVLLQNLYNNDGRTTSEKSKAIGFQIINDAYNLPKEFKDMWANIERDLDEFLAKGMVPNIQWGYTGNSWTFIDHSDNVVRNRMISDHQNRYFAYDSEYKRNSKVIRDLDYEGFKKQDATNSFIEYGAGSNIGITVLQYIPEGEFAKSKVQGNRLIAVLDASNVAGYNNFLNFLKKTEQAGQKLDGIVIRNMGLIDKYQDFSKILAQMPDSIQKLTLFFEARDTSSLIGLKDKKIQELDLYNSSNTVADDWGINPYVLRGVKNITFDYNHESITTSTVQPNNKNMPGSIVFNTLKFDKGMTLDQINEGLRIALKDRYGERIFQGAFGDGSWPTYLDFSNLPEIKSLQGMNFYGRVFKKLTLYNNSNVFTVDSKTLHQQQWSALLIKGPDRPKLMFVSPQKVDTLYIQGNAVDLGNNWGPELYGLIESGKYVFQTVYVDNETMANTLNNSQAFTTFGKRAIVKPSNFDTNGGNSVIISFE